jgi:cytochrome c-type biogenesis protein CcmE
LRNLYLRWIAILIVGIVIILFARQRYLDEVAVITPEQLKMEASSASLRVQGRIEPGTLKVDAETHQAHFDLSWKENRLPVSYSGEDLDTLREFKVIVLIGSWDPATQRFESKKLALTPNYGFITAAYLAGLFPLALFLFYMERRVVLLYDVIKREKIYQPEETL